MKDPTLAVLLFIEPVVVTGLALWSRDVVWFVYMVFLWIFRWYVYNALVSND